jgi:hypothetical protein
MYKVKYANLQASLHGITYGDKIKLILVNANASTTSKIVILAHERTHEFLNAFNVNFLQGLWDFADYLIRDFKNAYGIAHSMRKIYEACVTRY